MSKVGGTIKYMRMNGAGLGIGGIESTFIQENGKMGEWGHSKENIRNKKRGT